jgi:HTH-type transcriptional regulator, transcriptional repressor of NAD biosynthesis genes
MFRDALVVGKFYPFHRGHKYLIETALSQSERVTVFVFEKPEQTISGELRRSWIQATHPAAEVIVVDDTLPDDDSQAWAHETIRILQRRPEAVFSSEDYGAPYAACMGAKHVLVDRQRMRVPISASQIRAAPLSYLEFLEPVVRAFFVKRVCVIGAASTGTTTLARALAQSLQTVWVPEYGRTYSEGKLQCAEYSRWDTEEFLHVAATQCAMEDELAKRANKVLICDTNAFATCFWHERYMNFWSEDVEAIGRGRKYDLYLLTDIDIPLTPDGMRDGDSIRNWMHRRLIEELEKRRLPYVLLSGPQEVRLQSSLHHVRELIAACS